MNRIALIEPDERLCSELRQTLTRLGWQVVEASDAASALSSKSLRMALVDAGRPSGLDNIRLLASQEPPVSVVAIGGGLDPNWLAEARRAGAVVCLRKPFRLQMLESTLSAAALPQSLPQSGGPSWGPMATHSDAMASFLADLREAAAIDATVLIVGEVGAGKRTYARLLHHWSGRSGPLIEVPCATLSDSSEVGVVCDAAGGTRVLHRIGELTLPLQAALLQDLDARIPDRDPGPRLVVTACRPLAEEVEAGRLMPSLRHRLDVVALHLPPLRERVEDIPTLAAGLLAELSAENASAPPRLSRRAALALSDHRFPGNVRELRNLMRRAVLLQAGAELDVDWLLGRHDGAARPSPSLVLDTVNLRELERRAVTWSLAQHRGNRTHASRELGISVRTLRNKIRDYGLR